MTLTDRWKKKKDKKKIVLTPYNFLAYLQVNKQSIRFPESYTMNTFYLVNNLYTYNNRHKVLI